MPCSAPETAEDCRGAGIDFLRMHLWPVLACWISVCAAGWLLGLL